MTNPSLPLSDKEIDVLNDFLMSEAISDETMLVDELDGYLTAIVIGPTTVNFGEWFPGVWGPSEDDAPDFESEAEARHIVGLIVRQMNSIISAFTDDPDNIAPIFATSSDPRDPHQYIDGEMWAYGFMQGIALCRKDWQPLFDDVNGLEALRPIYLLDSGEVSEEDALLAKTPEQREELAQQIPESLAFIYRFWLPYRQAAIERMTIRNTTKVGRNDPCPCGSGLKFKKCCGTSTTLH